MGSKYELIGNASWDFYGVIFATKTIRILCCLHKTLQRSNYQKMSYLINWIVKFDVKSNYNFLGLKSRYWGELLGSSFCLSASNKVCNIFIQYLKLLSISFMWSAVWMFGVGFAKFPQTIPSETIRTQNISFHSYTRARGCKIFVNRHDKGVE